LGFRLAVCAAAADGKTKSTGRIKGALMS
jgi:hypothetical protein